MFERELRESRTFASDRKRSFAYWKPSIWNDLRAEKNPRLLRYFLLCFIQRSFPVMMFTVSSRTHPLLQHNKLPNIITKSDYNLRQDKRQFKAILPFRIDFWILKTFQKKNVSKLKSFRKKILFHGNVWFFLETNKNFVLAEF